MFGLGNLGANRDDIQKLKKVDALGLMNNALSGFEGDPPSGGRYLQVLLNTRNKNKSRVEDFRGSYGTLNSEKVGMNDSEIYNFMNTKPIRGASYLMDGKHTTFNSPTSEGGLDRIVGENYRMLNIPMDKINDPEYAQYLKQLQSPKFGKWDKNLASIEKQLAKYDK